MPVSTEGTIPATAQKSLGREFRKQDLPAILEQHRKWVESDGDEGTRADLSGAALEGIDLTGANLRGAVLRKANLRKADLFMAELQGACLAQANLEQANLLGAQLREAGLQGAMLAGATGLSIGQLAGADLFEALLPVQLLEFVTAEHVRRLGKNVARILALILLFCGMAYFRLFTTTDVQLVKNSPALPLPHLGDALPTVELYLVAPVVLLGLYLYFHLCLQRLWERLADLPAIFPDGQRLSDCPPWPVMALTRNQIKWLRRNRSFLSFLEAGISIVFAYWIAPITLVLFWARHLTRLDLQGTMLHVLLVVSAVAVAALFPALWAGTRFTQDEQGERATRKSAGGNLSRRLTAALTVGLVLFLLSLGTIFGAPLYNRRGGEPRTSGPQSWAANVFWAVRYDPYPNLAELEISTKPANWSGRDDELGLVKGARLNRLNLRHAEAHRAFLVNAHLWATNLENADLSEADLRGADLHRGIARLAVMDRARISRANLEGADLRGASLHAADLRQANLSFALLDGGNLVDAKLEGANLYGADLRAARLSVASLERADLREANLEAASLPFAVLPGADLWSAKLSRADLRQAQLGHAILIQADLRKANLRDADLREAILTGSDLSGADLSNADLRGATGLTAAQICSAAAWREVTLDENLEAQVEVQCKPLK